MFGERKKSIWRTIITKQLNEMIVSTIKLGAVGTKQTLRVKRVHFTKLELCLLLGWSSVANWRAHALQFSRFYGSDKFRPRVLNTDGVRLRR